MGLFEMLLGMGFLVIILLILGFVFWLWMFIDVLKRRDMMWAALFVVSFLTGFLSGLIATLYYFIVYRKNKTIEGRV